MGTGKAGAVGAFGSSGSYVVSGASGGGAASRRPAGAQPRARTGAQSRTQAAFSSQLKNKPKAKGRSLNGNTVFSRLISFYMELLTLMSDRRLDFRLGEEGRSFVQLTSSLPVWSLAGAAAAVTGAEGSAGRAALMKATAGFAGRRCDFAGSDSSLTMAWPVELRQGRMIPIFYIRLSAAVPQGDSLCLQAFAQDLQPQLNDTWLNEHFPPKDPSSRARRAAFVQSCSRQLNAEVLTAAGVQRQFKFPEAWAAAAALLQYFNPQEDLRPQALRLCRGSHGDGIYNTALVCRSSESPYVKSTLHDLQQLRQCRFNFAADSPDTAAARTNAAAGSVLPYLFFKPLPSPEICEELVFTESGMPFNQEQRQAAASMLQNRLTVLQGPPGTGKTQVIAAAAVNAAAQGKTVLITSYNHQAITAVLERLNRLDSARDLAVRVNSDDSRETASLYKSLSELEIKSTFRIGQVEEAQRKAASKVQELRRHYAQLDLCREQIAGRAYDQRRAGMLFMKFPAVQADCLKLQQFCQKPGALPAQKRRVEKLCAALRRLQELEFKQAPLLLRGLRLWWLQLKLKPALYACFGRGRADFLHRFTASAEQSAAYLDFLDLCRAGVEREIFLKKQGAADAKQLQAREQAMAGERSLVQIAFLNALRLLREAAYLQDPAEDLSPAQLSPLHEYASSDLAGRDRINAQLLQDAAAIRNMRRAAAQVFAHHRIWLCSSFSVNRFFPLLEGLFELVIFDESSQFDFIGALPILYRAKAAAVAGDPAQLEPVIRNMDWERQREIMHRCQLPEQLKRRLLLMNEQPFRGCACNSLYLFAARVPRAQCLMLTASYRSCRQITDFISALSYDGLLESKRQVLPPLPYHRAYHHGFVWVDVPDRVQRRAQRDGAGSRISEPEAEAVTAQLRQIVLEAGFKGSVGVISPYKAQADLIAAKIRRVPELTALLRPEQAAAAEQAGPALFGEEEPFHDDEDLFVSSVHRSQGSERDVIILSLCASGNMSNNFIERRRVLNVAVSRARSLVVVVSNLKAAVQSGASFLKDLAVEAGCDISRWDLQRDPQYRQAAEKFESPYERALYLKMREEGLQPVLQHRIAAYRRRLDFALIDEKRGCYLDIEVDGSNHLDSLGRRKQDDYVRDAQMRSLNYRIIRFWTREVGADPRGCARQVRLLWQEMLQEKAGSRCSGRQSAGRSGGSAG